MLRTPGVLHSFPHRLGLLLLLCFTIQQVTLAQLNPVRYAGNPVLRSQSQMDDQFAFWNLNSPSVMVESSADGSKLFKMWFASNLGYFGSVSTICYAESRDGKHWFLYLDSPVLVHGPAGSFDEYWVIDPSVIKVGNEYRMYYTAWNGQHWTVGLARSSDGIQWLREGSGPVLDVEPGNWDSYQSNAPAVVARDSDFVMMYTGGAGSDYKIGMAYSKDGITWTRGSSQPVLLPGGPGSWDANGVVVTSMVKRDSLLYLFYHTPASAVMPGGAFGLAISSDGLSWQKYPTNPIFLPNNGYWDTRVQTGCFVPVDDTLRFWYAGYYNTWQIGHAWFNTPWDQITLGVKSGDRLPLRFALSEGYPNPFNPSAAIEFDVPQMTRVVLRVFDTLGQQVDVLVDEVKPGGHYKVTWSPNALASGAYFCRMEAGSFSATKKLILLR
jgi:predicted GH43/DUF377 family glycosyl hydrolase